MAITFRPAAASEAKLLIGFYAESGTGKTKSSLLLAKGYVSEIGASMRAVGMIETESGRGEAYARDDEVGGYNVVPLRGDFSPKAYGEALAALERERMRVGIIDSASHEWEGIGGVLDMAAKNQADGKKGVQVWQQPKIQHKREFMLRMMQTPLDVVVCNMRAKYPMKEATVEDIERARQQGRKPPQKGDWIRSDRLEPTQADDILFEMFVHGWIDHEHRFHLTKSTVDDLRDVFRDGEPINVDTGRRLARWASGRADSKPAPQQSAEPARAGHDAPASRLTTAAAAGPDPAREKAIADWCAALDAAANLDDLKTKFDSAIAAVEPFGAEAARQVTLAKNKRGRELTAGRQA